MATAVEHYEGLQIPVALLGHRGLEALPQAVHQVLHAATSHAVSCTARRPSCSDCQRHHCSWADATLKLRLKPGMLCCRSAVPVPGLG